MILRLLTCLTVFSSCLPSWAQSFAGRFPAAFQQIDTAATCYKVTVPGGMAMPVGGHIQGVQVTGNMLYLTGSSATFGYCAVCSINSVHNATVTSIDTLAQNPYRHAGGFQISGGFMAVGVEDNRAKDKSVVALWPVGAGAKPLYIAHRSGSYKRSTAGATGITRLASGRLLIVVGDWDSRNLDFYLSRTGSGTLFDSLTTYHVADGVKWGSYQSINLVTDTTGAVYLLGFCRYDSGNRADLFKLNLSYPIVSLTPLAVRYFKCPLGTSFRYGAGISFMPRGRPVIYATQRRLKHSFRVAAFG